MKGLIANAPSGKLASSHICNECLGLCWEIAREQKWPETLDPPPGPVGLHLEYAWLVAKQAACLTLSDRHRNILAELIVPASELAQRAPQPPPVDPIPPAFVRKSS